MLQEGVPSQCRLACGLLMGGQDATPSQCRLAGVWGGFVCLRPVRSEVSRTSGDLLILVALLGAMFLYGCFVVGLYGSLSAFEELAGGEEEEEDGEGVLYGYNPEGGGVAEVLGDDAS